MTDQAFKSRVTPPILHVKDMPTAFAYYRDKLGFVVDVYLGRSAVATSVSASAMPPSI